MLHLVLYGLLAIIVAGGLFFVASRFLPAGEQIAPALRDEPPWALPADRTLGAEDIDTVRLPVALRGYRFAETDILLDRLAGELRARDTEIERLRSHAFAGPAPPEPTVAPGSSPSSLSLTKPAPPPADGYEPPSRTEADSPADQAEPGVDGRS